MRGELSTVCRQPGCGALLLQNARQCPKCGSVVSTDLSDSITIARGAANGATPGNGLPPRELEIDTGERRRWAGWVTYLFFFLLVATALVALFVRFTGSVRLALILVSFMIAYMLIMGWLAARDPERRE